MPTCPSCGATVARAAAFCGECGGEAPESRPDRHAGTAATTDRLKRKIREQRAAEERGWLTPRGKAVFYALVGIAGLATGYWLGFVGYLDTAVGSEGYGQYTVTQPAVGTGLLLVGAVALLAGLVTLWLSRT